MNDDTLLDGLAADLDGSFEALVLGHVDRCYSIALRILGNPHDAEEAAQDALVRAYRALAEYPPERILALRLRPWLTTIVVNVCRNRTRRRVLPSTPLEALAGVGIELPAGDADRSGGCCDPDGRSGAARDAAVHPARSLPDPRRAAPCR